VRQHQPYQEKLVDLDRLDQRKLRMLIFIYITHDFSALNYKRIASRIMPMPFQNKLHFLHGIIKEAIHVIFGEKSMQNP
jgi:hypothetical protein